MNVLALGLGVTGLAVARHCRHLGWTCVVVEDNPRRPGHAERVTEAEGTGASVMAGLDADALRRQVQAADTVVPSPGVAVGHPAFVAARDADVPVLSEIELASRATQIPLVAVTGTNGKTTVTTLVTAMLRASGWRAEAAGNIGRPLIDAVHDDLDAIVAEVSSFQLHFTEQFRPRTAVILNLADDHLDWHPSFEHYRDAKARVFRNQSNGDAVVLNADDVDVAALASRAPGEVVWFTTAGIRADAFHVAGGALRKPSGEPFFDLAELPRRLPHDIANALASSAAALHAGADLAGVAEALRADRTLPHTLTLVEDAGGVRWYDDSKATNPHATLAALSGFDSVVLLAGGRNKGLDLQPLAQAASRLRSVVAFGEAAKEVEAVFRGLRPVERALTMREAVRAAAELARPGDAVILSPACASFDAYSDYRERGDDFTREVRELTGADGAMP